VLAERRKAERGVVSHLRSYDLNDLLRTEHKAGLDRARAGLERIAVE
jgi:hypothetical protein